MSVGVAGHSPRNSSSKKGISAEKLAAVADYATSPLFSADERAALAFAAEAMQVGARVSNTTFAGLRRHVSEQEIVELAAAVACENMFNRFNAPLEVESQGFCAIPTRPASMRRKSA